ncbi:hypothetical protein HDU91_003989, partial [Kappamyces sp. JEL0680]
VQESHSQRAAAEVIGGLLRGSKHWNPQQLEHIEKDIVPLLFKGLQTSTMETVRHWLDCLGYVFRRRDPNRFASIINPILHASFDLSNASFLAESKKLWLKDKVLGLFTIRFQTQSLKLIEELTEIVSTPYQQVRNGIGLCYDTCLQLRPPSAFRTVQELTRHHAESWPAFEVSSVLRNPNIDLLFGKLKQLKSLPVVPGAFSEYGNAAKTGSWSALTTSAFLALVGPDVV